ncbi:MAG: tRNA 2-thiouridine(34) synthase MnmA [Planctomycetota bacterium]|jgi:tRNA-specific 2-thiouridylase
MRIAAAMSGGVDSSVAAMVLRDEGHEVFGLTAWLWRCDAPDNARACCGSLEGLRRARDAAEALGLRHEVVDLSGEFEREVVAHTVTEYAAGRTPNPCVVCNARVRFPYLVKAARDLGAEAFATGHYARLEPRPGADAPDGVRLLRGRDPGHDQSYFLSMVGPDELGFSRFPLGGMLKEETRERAGAADHPAAERPSSQDLCFTGAREPGALVAARAPEAARPGPVVDTSGRVLGEHRGLAHYTIGQRKGIGVTAGRPLFVKELRPETNELVVTDDDGPGGELGCARFKVGGLTWLARPDASASEFDTLVQIRYRSPATAARVRVEGERAEVELANPARAVAPGQCAVFYGDSTGGGGTDEVLGGGWIARGAPGPRSRD